MGAKRSYPEAQCALRKVEATELQETFQKGPKHSVSLEHSLLLPHEPVATSGGGGRDRGLAGLTIGGFFRGLRRNASR